MFNLLGNIAGRFTANEPDIFLRKKVQIQDSTLWPENQLNSLSPFKHSTPWQRSWDTGLFHSVQQCHSGWLDSSFQLHLVFLLQPKNGSYHIFNLEDGRGETSFWTLQSGQPEVSTRLNKSTELPRFELSADIYVQQKYVQFEPGFKDKTS